MTSLRFQQVSERVATALKTKSHCINGKSIIFLPVLLTLVILFLSTPASAAEARYKNPKIGGYALDYCKKWGKECGKPAADAYCRKKGYRRALKYRVRRDTPPTKVISSGQVCQAPGCDRINYVVCEAEAVFRNPTVGKYPLDFCQQWGKGCGKPAADAFCRYRGYGRSVDFAVRPDRPPTKVIGTGQVCNQPYCDRIVLVTCRDRKGGGGGQGSKSAGGSAQGKADDAGDALSDSDDTDDYGLFEE